MPALIEYDGVVALLDEGVWSCDDPLVLNILEAASDLCEPRESGIDPNFDLIVAEQVINLLGTGRVVSYTNAPAVEEMGLRGDA